MRMKAKVATTVSVGTGVSLTAVVVLPRIAIIQIKGITAVMFAGTPTPFSAASVGSKIAIEPASKTLSCGDTLVNKAALCCSPVFVSDVRTYQVATLVGLCCDRSLQAPQCLPPGS